MAVAAWMTLSVCALPVSLASTAVLPLVSEGKGIKEMVSDN